MADLSSILDLEPPEAAPKLLGCVISHEIDGQVIRGVITETEAYTADDPASHSFNGESVRNRAMFGNPGDVYVYLIYGMHYCLNIVTGKKKGGAVLIRALTVSDGLKAAWRNRYKEALPLKPSKVKLDQLANGPGKVAQLLGIDTSFNHVNLLDPDSTLRLYMQPGQVKVQALQTPRIGITKGADTPWRWILQPN
jgi:DNA-3-methyladenine glycosylase